MFVPYLHAMILDDPPCPDFQCLSMQEVYVTHIWNHGHGHRVCQVTVTVTVYFKLLRQAWYINMPRQCLFISRARFNKFTVTVTVTVIVGCLHSSSHSWDCTYAFPINHDSCMLYVLELTLSDSVLARWDLLVFEMPCLCAQNLRF